MKFQFEYRYPYSFSLTTRRLLFFDPMYVHHEGVLYRAMHGVDGPLVLRIEECMDKSALHIEVLGDGEKEKKHLENRLRRIFSLDVDLTPFYQGIGTGEDGPFSRMVKEREGLHLVLDVSLYECLMKTIIGQQLNLAFASTLVKRLIELSGDTVTIDTHQIPVFPKPEQVASLEYEDLQALQFSRKKAEYVIDISRKVAKGELDLDSLYNKSDEVVFSTLLPLRGIGRWTVECFLLFGLGSPNLLPAADIGLRNAVKALYGWDVQPDEERIRQLGEDWNPYCSYVTFYLWDTLK